jgi:uncharacterized Zn finger protein (UPF0148 family)
MNTYSCGKCEKAVSKTDTICPHCGVRLSGIRELSARQKASRQQIETDYLDERKRRRDKKELELEERRQTERLRTKISQLGDKIRSAETKPKIFREQIQKSAFSKLIRMFLDQNVEEIKSAALATISTLNFDFPELTRPALLSIQSDLIDILKDHMHSIDLRTCAISALGIVASEKAVDTLMNRLDSRGLEKARVVIALVNTKDPRALIVVRDVLSTGDNKKVEEYVIRQLGSYGDKRYAEFIIPMLGNPHAEIRSAAAYTLGCLEETTAIPQLLFLLASDENSAVRVNAARALGMVADVSAVPELEKAGQERYAPLDEACTNALQSIMQRMDE